MRDIVQAIAAGVLLLCVPLFLRADAADDLLHALATPGSQETRVTAQPVAAPDNSAAIKALQEQIVQLQKMLADLIATKVAQTARPPQAPQALELPKSPPPASVLTRNLSRGSRGDDVKQLQQFLISQNLLASDSATGFFGVLTEKAVQAWQKKNNIVSSGAPATTGYGAVGPKTRAALKAAIASFVGRTPALSAAPRAAQRTLTTISTTTLKSLEKAAETFLAKRKTSVASLSQVAGTGIVLGASSPVDMLNAPTPSEGSFPLPVSFSGTVNADSGCAAATYGISYGDQTVEDVAVPGGACGPIAFSLSHTYQLPGQYLVILFRGSVSDALAGAYAVVGAQLITVTGSTGGPPDLHIYANDTEGEITVPKNSTAQITWLARNVQNSTCWVYGPRATPLNDINLFNGSGIASVPLPGQQTGPLTERAVFTLRCLKTDGTPTVAKTVSVKIAEVVVEPIQTCSGSACNFTAEDFESAGTFASRWATRGDAANVALVESPAGSGNEALRLGSNADSWDVSVTSNAAFDRTGSRVTFDVWHESATDPGFLGWYGPWKRQAPPTVSAYTEAGFDTCAGGSCWAEGGQAGTGPLVQFGANNTDWKNAKGRAKTLRVRVELGRSGASAEYSKDAGATWMPVKFYAPNAQIISDQAFKWKTLDTQLMPTFTSWHGIQVSSNQSNHVGFGGVGNGAIRHPIYIDNVVVDKEVQPAISLPYVNPNASLPSFVNFASGSWESDTMPDTFDLTESARYSIQGLTGPLYDPGDYDMYWFAQLNTNPPRMDFPAWERLLPQFWANMQWMRIMTGSNYNVAVDQAWQNRLVKSLSPTDGGLSFSLNKSFVLQDKHSDADAYKRILGFSFINDVYAQDWALYTLANLYRFTQDLAWKLKGERVVSAIQNASYQSNGNSQWGPYAYISAPAFTSTYRGTSDVITGWGSSELGGRLILGMTNFYAATGNLSAKTLAQKFVNYMLHYGGYFEYDTGAFVWDKDGVGSGEGTGTGEGGGAHFYRHTQILNSTLDYALLTSDTAARDFVNRSYNWAKDAPCSNAPQTKCTNTDVGWFPEFLSTTWPKSDYGVADMVQIGVKLSAAGVGDYWDEVERWTRNQFSAQQLQNVDWVEEYASQFSQNTLCSGVSSELGCTIKHVGARVLGSWGGFVRPNEYLLQGSQPGGGEGVMEDSTGDGPMALYQLWKNSITRKDDYLKINLLLNRASPYATVYSYIPYQARVDVKIKDTGIKKLYVRVPSWIVDETKVKITKNSAVVPSTVAGNYLLVSGAFANGDRISVVYADQMPESIKTMTLRDSYYTPTMKTFTFTVRGDTVISVSPAGQRGAFYTDRLKYRGAPQTKSVQNFIFGNQNLLNDYLIGPLPTGKRPTTASTTITASPENILSGQTSFISWSSPNANACAVFGPGTTVFNGSGWTSLPSPGQETPTLTEATTYTLRCWKADGTELPQKTATVTVASIVTGPDLRIYANGTEGSITVPANTTVPITWQTTGVASCSVYGPKSTPLGAGNVFNGSGNISYSGTGAQTGTLTVSSIYTLVCATSTGATRYKTVVVNITGAQTITANPTVVASGGTSFISWSAPSASACVVYGPNDTSTVFNGSGAIASPQAQGAGPFSLTSTYTLRCWMPDNSTVDTQATVIVQ